MMQRRGFLKTLVGLVAGGAAAPVVAAPGVDDVATATECARILAQSFPEEFMFCTVAVSPKIAVWRGNHNDHSL